MPSITYCFQLLDENNLTIGVCSFGYPMASQLQDAVKGKFEVMELNRLCVNDGLPENSLSFFVGQCLNMLPKPKIIIQYSDFRMGHNGYIYQATNWLYTGVGGEGQNIYIMKDGTERHQRHEDKNKD